MKENDKKEITVFDSEAPRTLQEIGWFLVQMGKRLSEQGFLILKQGDSRVEVRPTKNALLELEYEIKGTKHSLEIEIEWEPEEETLTNRL